jgi:ABC-type multidrug transport system permease subunit
MKKLLATFLNDAKLSFRGLYFYIELGMALIFILVMLFVVPENFENSQRIFLVDETPDQNLSRVLSNSEVEIFKERGDLEKALEEDRSGVGLVLSMEKDILIYDFVLQGYESERMIQTITASFEAQLRRLSAGDFEGPSIEYLKEKTQALSNRTQVLPVYLAMNIGLMGLFIIAAYIFLDKEEGVIKAYAVAPVSIFKYLLSKTMVMMMTGLATSIPIVLLLHGLDVNYLYLILAIISFSFFGSALGLLVSSFFDTMMKAMGVLYLVIMLMLIPTLSYFMPSFNPVWMKFLPSYHMLFTFRDLLVNQGETFYILMSILSLFGLGVVALYLATLKFKQSLTV